MFEWQLNHLVDLDNFTKIIRHLPANESTFHVYGSFGDVYLQLSNLKELFEQKGEAFHILIDEKYNILANQALESNIGKLYSNSNSIANIFNKIGLVGTTGNLPIRLLPGVYPGCSELILSNRLYYSDFLRGIVGNNKKGFFSKIEDFENLNKQAENLILEAGCKPYKSILLSLDNNTQKEFSSKFWMENVEFINNLGYSILLNDSGTLNTRSANLLSNTSLPRVKVPPNLAVTLPTVAGGYMGGSNGFSTIQALFNDTAPGIYFINAIESERNKVVDKFGNEFDESALYHSIAFKEEFRKTQIEVLVSKNTKRKLINEIIFEYIKIISNR